MILAQFDPMQDTVAAWLGAIGGVLSVLIAAYALWVAIRAERRHVEWQLTNERKPDGRRSDAWRLVNTSSGVSANVTSFENISENSNALRGELDLPVIVEPGAFMPFTHSRSVADPWPTVVHVTWQEARPHGRFRRKTYASTLYID